MGRDRPQEIQQKYKDAFLRNLKANAQKSADEVKEETEQEKLNKEEGNKEL